MRKGDDPKTNARGGNRVYNLLGDFTDTRARAETDELRWNRGDDGSVTTFRLDVCKQSP